MDDDARSRREHRRGAAAGAAQPPGEAAQAGAADEGGAHVDGVRMSGRAAPDVRPVRRRGRTRARLPVALDRRFEAVVFDWDGTAVPDRSADASRVRALVEGACARGIHVGIVSGTHVRNVDGQLLARPREPRLHLLLNRGSEVYVVGPRGPRLVSRRSATAAEEQALNAAASLAAERLAARGIETRVIADRLNRRKIDLIPLPEWSDPPKARIAELSDAVTRRLAGCSLPEAVAVCRAAARDAGLPDARVTTDVKHVEIGLTDKSDSREWMLEELWRHGIGPRSVLVLGDELGPLGGLPGSDARLLAPGVTAVSVGAEPEGVPDGVIHLGGGPARFARLLDDQLARRDRGAPPAVAPEPGWALELAADEAHERVHEALFTLADGRIGTRGSALRRGPASGTPSVLAAGVYGGEGPASELLPCPEWNRLGAVLAHQPGARRVLDLHAGIAAQEIRAPEGVVDVVCFSSLARPGVAVLDAGCVEPGPPLGDGDGDGDQVAAADGVPGGVVAAARQSRRSGRVRRIAAYATDGRRRPGPRRARDALARAHAAGFDRLLDEHRSAWARRWQDADIVLDGDDELQLAVRFALFHLMSSVRTRGEAAVGARGLSGPAYRGHVFWDSDAYVLPFLAATHPPAARAMLEYRLRRLPSALAAARAAGRRGARFPWESAATGDDVTPDNAVDLAGRSAPVLTGTLEEHVVADVAWAASCYAAWSGDGRFLSGAGAPLVVETARWWADRVELDLDGRGHIRGVMGPDEYHPRVDDNAYTNVMARWNLRQAARLGAGGAPGIARAEARRWVALADALVDGHDPRTGVYEQFAGFHALEPLVIAEIAPRRPVAADLLLGAERVAGAQVVKQADVLMLHHLVPDEVAPETLEANLGFYEPRTAHGSSLSPGVHASLFARAGQLDRALELLQLTARIDLEDLTGTTAGGVHLAAMASVWHALAYGFCGLRAQDDALALDPRLPPEWQTLEIRLRYRRAAVRVRCRHDGTTVWADPPIAVRTPTEGPVVADAAGVGLRNEGDG